MVGIVGTEREDMSPDLCQVGIKAHIYPDNYPAITAQLAANALINATDTSC